MGTFVIILASAIWGAVHSVLASLGAKAAARQALGDGVMRWYRLLYNAFSLITFLPLLALAALLPDRLLYTIPAPWIYLSLAFQAVAAVALVVALLQTDLWSFLGLSQPFRSTDQPGTLFTGGLYRLVRHPLYSTGLLILWLAPQMTVNRLVLIVGLTIYIVVGAMFEERKLVREFGSAYVEYKARTPMLIPGLRWHRQGKNLESSQP
jgi:protein-S-isoprenylcysteine O-methyltransferase Ste14